MKRFITIFAAVMLIFSLCFTANAAGDDDIVLSNCDTTLNWSANSQGMDALEGDAANFVEGSGSVGATAINGKLNQIAYVPSAPIDISKYSYMEFDIYFSDITWFTDCGGVMIELTSSGTTDKESNRYMKKVMRHLFENGAIEGKQNWWHFVLVLDDPQGTANGQLDKTRFNFFRFYSVDPISTTPDYTMRIDNVRFTNNPENYVPMVDEKEESSGISNTSSEKATVYVPKRTDKNLELRAELENIVNLGYIAVGVAGVFLVAVIVLFIVKLKKNKS